MDFRDSSRWSSVLALVIAIVVGFVIGYVVQSALAGDVAKEIEAIAEAESQQLEENLERSFGEKIRAMEDRLESFDGTTQPEGTPEQPWPYVKLDVEEARKLGHRGYYDNACGYGPFNAVISMLQEEIGYPYDQIPTYMLHFGGAGFVGEEAICGTVLGSVAAINLIVGEGYGPLAREVIDYYKETPLPTDQSNEYAQNHEFLVDEYLSDEFIVQTVAGNVSCRVSKEVWIEASGHEMGDDERKERCARITGDMAAKTVEVLNAWYDEVHDGAEADATEAFDDIFPGAEFSLLEDDVFEATRDGELIGYVAVGKGEGHENVISVAVGVDLAGTLCGVRVVDHAETAGIGDAIENAEFVDQFEGLSEGEIATTGDGGAIDAISSATVSSEAVVDIVADRFEVLLGYLD